MPNELSAINAPSFSGDLALCNDSDWFSFDIADDVIAKYSEDL